MIVRHEAHDGTSPKQRAEPELNDETSGTVLHACEMCEQVYRARAVSASYGTASAVVASERGLCVLFGWRPRCPRIDSAKAPTFGRSQVIFDRSLAAPCRIWCKSRNTWPAPRPDLGPTRCTCFNKSRSSLARFRLQLGASLTEVEPTSTKLVANFGARDSPSCPGMGWLGRNSTKEQPHPTILARLRRI